MNDPALAPDEWRFIRRVLLVAATGVLCVLLWQLRGVLMLLFASLLLAVMFTAMAGFVSHRTPLPRGGGLAVALLAFFGLVAAFLWVFGAQLRQQVEDIAKLLPPLIEEIERRFDLDLDENALSPSRLLEYVDAGGFTGALGYGFSLFGVLADITIVVVGAIFLAANPDLYIKGTARLFPKSRRALAEQALRETGEALKRWLGGQLLVMLGVGLMSWAAYAVIGLPSAGGLAFIAGLADFVPFVGPILGAIPALVLAATQDVQTLLWTLGAVVVIQQIESNVLMPLVQKRAVKLPPFIGIFSILVFGTLFGVLGMLLAVPLALAIMVLVQRLWVNTALGDDMPVMGQGDARD